MMQSLSVELDDVRIKTQAVHGLKVRTALQWHIWEVLDVTRIIISVSDLRGLIQSEIRR